MRKLIYRFQVPLVLLGGAAMGLALATNQVVQGWDRLASSLPPPFHWVVSLAYLLVAAVTFAIVAAVVHVVIRRHIAAIAADSRVIWRFVGSGIVCAIALFTYSWLTDGFTAARAPYLLGFGFLLGFLLASLAINVRGPRGREAATDTKRH